MGTMAKYKNGFDTTELPPPELDTGLFGVDRPGVAWEWMKQTGQAPDTGDWVRPQVSEAWYRCIEDYGLSPSSSQVRPQVIETSKIRAHFGPASSLEVRRALGTMAFNLQPLLRDTGASLLLSDNAGAITHALDGESNLGPMGRRLVQLGESWNEAVVGNNGLGTAVKLSAPVAFEGKEHFSSLLHPFATVGHPLFSHDGALVAVLGLITDRRSSAQTLLGFARIACYLIEKNVFEIQAPGAFVLRMRLDGLCGSMTGQDCLLDGLLSLDEDGTIVGATRTALNLLRADSHASILLDKTEKVLGLPMKDILARASLGTPVKLEMPGSWPLKAELISLHPARIASDDPKRVNPGRAATSGRKAPVYGQGNGPWRDTVIEAALQKAVNLQKQKIPILITGESGVGKDHFVRRIHAESTRKGGPLVLVNCAAIPRDLIASELFGYAPGSFTGARSGGQAGKFVEAHKGILFLDEIGDMPLDLQTALLCALDNTEIVPVGGSKPVSVDVQVIAATNNDIAESVKKGSFRRDLYYRLNGAQFWLPPLRERPDKLELISHLWDKEIAAQQVIEPKALSEGVWDIFGRHPWPGNIRELRNVLRSCLAMASGPAIQSSDLPIDFLHEMNSANHEEEGDQVVSPIAKLQTPVERKALVEWEKEAIRSALAKTSGNISESARQLGITRATLYHKMARLGLSR